MREFEATYLFKVSFHPEYKFQKPPKPIYVVQGNKQEAMRYAESQGPTYKIKSVTLLARQYGGSYFASDFK